MDFCRAMLEETGVSTTPGSIFGRNGEGYMRISLTTEENRIIEAMDRVNDWIDTR
jgi:LL-diaminopimelate aminotransferase